MLWGIDLGGTKIEGIVLESYDNPKEVSRIRINTEAEKGYGHILNRIKELVGKLMIDSGDEPKHIGIGTPGTIDPEIGQPTSAEPASSGGIDLALFGGDMVGSNADGIERTTTFLSAVIPLDQSLTHIE